MFNRKFFPLLLVLPFLVSCSNQKVSFSNDSHSSSVDNTLELPSTFGEIVNKGHYYILTYVNYFLDSNISFSGDHSFLETFSWANGCLTTDKKFLSEEITISLNETKKTIFLSAIDSPFFKKNIVLAFGYDEKNKPKYWPNYQEKIQNFNILEEHGNEFLYGDTLSLTYSGEESWINSTETFYGSGSYCWVSPRTTVTSIEIIESIIIVFSFNDLGRLVPINNDIIIQSNDMEKCPNSINNGLVAFNSDGSLIELNQEEGQIIYGSCTCSHMLSANEYIVHAFYTYNPR